MPPDDTGDRTEEPTDKRREEARQQGNVPHSTDLNSAAHMLAAACVLLAFGPGMFRAMGNLMGRMLGETHLSIDRAFAVQIAWDLADWSSGVVLPVMGLMVLIAVAASLSQVGFLFTTQSLQPKLSRLNPVQGFLRLFQISALVRLLASLLKLVILVAVTAWFISSELPTFLQLNDASVGSSYARIGKSMIYLAFLLAAALIVLALLDFAFQRWKHEQDLKMTKQEVRDEMKNMDGDPQIRQRRREAHRKLAEAREIQSVQDADVVITNPTHVAVALKYNPEEMDAPKVVAKGLGELAHRIRQMAVESGVPVIERKELARTLYRTVKVGQPIPVHMYGVFVEIMAYVYRLTGRTPPDLTSRDGVR